MAYPYGASNAVSFGPFSASTLQQPSSIAIGASAGRKNQGGNAIAIGTLAGQLNQHQSTIVINATGNVLNTAADNATYMAPLRFTTASNVMVYNSGTKEVSYTDTVTNTFNVADASAATTYSASHYTSGENSGYYVNFSSADCFNGNGSATAFGRSIVMKSSDLIWPAVNPTNRLYGAQLTLQGGISDYASANVGGAVIATTGGAERLRITAGGNVGIGSAVPGSKLTVAGDVSLTGNVTANAYTGGSTTISYNNTSDKNKWFKIATVPSRGVGEIGVSWTAGGEHGYIKVSFGQQYNNTPFIRVIEGDYYGTAIVQQFRLATDNASIYNDAFVEMYLANASWYSADININVWIVNKPPTISAITLFTTKTAGTSTGYTYYQVYGYHPMDLNWNGARMCMANTGYVGIGTNNPSTVFDVIGSSATSGTLRVGTVQSGFAQWGSIYSASSGANYIVSNDGTRTVFMGTDGSGTIIGSHTNHDLLIRTNNSEKIRVTAGGNVGIGITNPSATFNVNGTSHLGYVSGSYGGIRIQNDYIFGIPSIDAITAGDQYSDFLINPYVGKLGIGIYTAPTAKLHVGGQTFLNGNVNICGQNDTNASLNIRNPNGSYTHFGYSNNWNYIRGNTNFDNAYVTIGNSYNFNFPLYINFVASWYWGLGYYMSYGSNVFHGANGSWNVSLWATGAIVTELWHGTSSDIRIKKNITPVNNMLDIINRIEVVRFDYIDEFHNKPDECGVIAQQLEDVFPNAVDRSKGTIPCFMKPSTGNYISGEDVTILFDKGKEELKIGDVIKIYVGGEDNKEAKEVAHNVTITSILDTGVVVKKWEKYEENKNIFVFGKEVDDYRNVDKEQLGVMALKGVQELHQIIKTQQQTITDLQQEFADYKRQTEERFDKVATLLLSLQQAPK